MKYSSVTHNLLLSGIVAVAVALSAALGAAGSAHAELIGDLVTVEAANQDGSAIFEVAVPGEPGEPVHWKLPGAQQLRAQGHDSLLGTIDDMEITLNGDPTANITFSVTAGKSGTTFTISSATVGFPAITNPIGFAAADLTLNDTDANGASISPVSPQAGVFQAVYNGGGSTWADLIGSQTVSPGGSVTVTASKGSQMIAGSVSDIQAKFHFTLSASDTATGHGRFDVSNPVPEPATLLLLGMSGVGLLVAAWRRRGR